MSCNTDAREDTCSPETRNSSTPPRELSASCQLSMTHLRAELLTQLLGATEGRAAKEAEVEQLQQ